MMEKFSIQKIECIINLLLFGRPLLSGHLFPQRLPEQLQAAKRERCHLASTQEQVNERLSVFL